MVRQARGSLTLEQFGAEVGLSYVTIWKLEQAQIKRLQPSTLTALAPRLGYTVDQLLAIATGTKPQLPTRPLLTASDVLPIIHQLPMPEKKRLWEIDLGSMSDDELLKAHQAVVDELHKRMKKD